MRSDDRTLIPTFVFWAFLTIITPTLILLSDNSNADLDLNGNITEAMNVRRMIGHTQNEIIRTVLPLPPSPAPTESQYLHHNHTIASNMSSDVHVQLQQINVRD